jgi:hypothetical protein
MTEGITEPGNLRLELFLLLCLAWVIVYFCLWRGTQLQAEFANVSLRFLACNLEISEA